MGKRPRGSYEPGKSARAKSNAPNTYVAGAGTPAPVGISPVVPQPAVSIQPISPTPSAVAYGMPAAAAAPAAVAAAALPQLQGIKDPDMDEGYAGNFSCRRDWHVENAIAGYIVQHITRTFTVFDISQRSRVQLVGQALDRYVTDPQSAVHATSTEYWEMWTVDQSGKIYPSGGDTFGLCSIISVGAKQVKMKEEDLVFWDKYVTNSTSGIFEICGIANFYQMINVGEFSKKLKVAGKLLSKLTPVTQPSIGAPVKFTIEASWDTSKEYGPTQITETNG